VIVERTDEDHNLDDLVVMHMLHQLDAKVGDVASTVRSGFKWAEAGEGQGLFLCVCVAPCLDSKNCGRTFWKDTRDTVGINGHKVKVPLKWLTAKDGTPLTLAIWCCANCSVKGSGSVEATWVGRFHDIPARLLRMEHEVRSRAYDGLFESMQKAYGKGFGEANYVTVVLYRRAS
jgi:hypothetical protein